jgi:uncharacterized protein DUF4145
MAGILQYKCPHCETNNIALDVIKAAPFERDAKVMVVHLQCPKCELPSSALMAYGGQEWPQQPKRDPQNYEWTVWKFWPEAVGPLIPESLPPDVERIYLQAEHNFPVKGNEEASGTMYRKALDVGLKKIDPDTTGTLAARIKKLAAANKLTPDIAEWSDHVRDLGNEAAHEEEPPTRAELADLRNFTEMVMRYLFSLPALVTARKPKQGA